MADGPRIELQGATRRFGALTAVSALDVCFEPGRVHALIGENGAGKSTALKLCAGLLPPTDGRVLVGGRELRPASPEEAIRRGIGMVHQHFMLIEPFTALENLVLGSEPTGAFGKLDLGRARAEAVALGEAVGLSVELDRVTSELGVGERQRLEILRVLYRGARAVLLDEPTAVLSPLEVADLYATLRRLAGDGATVVVVTHRLDEVVAYCDHVSVMRQGSLVLSEPIDPEPELSERLTRAVMGGELPQEVAAPRIGEQSEPALVIDGLSVDRGGGGAALDGFSLRIRPGEVVGVAGVEGNGQRELAAVLGGLLAPRAGSVTVGGSVLFDGGGDATEAVRRARARGLVVVHEDRHQAELVLGATVADNLVVGDLGQLEDERQSMEQRFARFDIQPPDPRHDAADLSGGNQQKLVLARALDRPLAVLVLAQPTRGVDVGTAATIHQAIADVAEAGAAVLLISADLSELRRLSHRLLVIRRGRVVASLPPSAGDQEIGAAMLGVQVGAEDAA